MADPNTIRDLLEPAATEHYKNLIHPIDSIAILSTAISLKRIADALDADELPRSLRSVNAYGENFAVAIQEGIVRGLKGISQYD